MSRSAQGALVIDVTDHEKAKTKQFKQTVADEGRMTDHFNSLTDDLIEGFWPQPRKKKAKKGGASAETQEEPT